jgi:hypothetical protein
MPGQGGLVNSGRQTAVNEGHAPSGQSELMQQIVILQGYHYVNQRISDAENSGSRVFFEDGHWFQNFDKNIFFV